MTSKIVYSTDTESARKAAEAAARAKKAAKAMREIAATMAAK